MALNFANSQPSNIVKDSGFECLSPFCFDTTSLLSCEEFGQLDTIYRYSGLCPCLPWFGNSVDLMTACIRWQGLPLITDNYPITHGLTGFSTVPQNYGGWQYPHRGNNYLHLGYSTKSFNVDTTVREHANSPVELVAQKEYCVGFYTVLADSSNMFSYGPGIKFYDHDPYLNTGGLIHDYNPDVWGNFFMDDSVNWRKVSGTYTATGQEQFFTIGNFWTASEQNNPKAPINNTYTGFGVCRIYIDDVFITELSNINAGENKDICLGDSVTLGSAEIPGADYTWYPAEGLSNIHAAQPKAAPKATTTYHLIMDQCRILYDSVTVTVRNPNELAIFPKEISACKGTSVTIAPSNTYNNSGSTLAFIPANNFIKIYPDSAIFNAEQNTNIAVVQQFNGACAQVQNKISIKAITCKDSPICGGYVNENSILLTPFPTKELTIYSLAGSIVFYASNYNNDYNLSSLSSGIYLLKQKFADGTEKVCKLGWVNR